MPPKTELAATSSTRHLEATEIDGVAGGLLPSVTGTLKLMGEILSNVSKVGSEISMTFARNARA